MDNKNQKQDGKTLKQMYEEINQKISETKEKREAFVTAADTIKEKTFFLKCCEEILRNFRSIKYADSFNSFYFSYTLNLRIPSDVKIKTISQEYFSQELQKLLDKYSPVKLKIEKTSFYPSLKELDVTISLV